jgi:hypothetical protein
MSKGDREIVKLFFDDREETLGIIDSGGDLFTYLTGKKTFCPLVGSRIKLERVLGEGAYGAVFEIDFPGRGKKRYAVKKSEVYTIVPCSTESHYERLDGKGVTVIPKGSSICKMAYSEYGISLLVGEFARDGTCINFMDVFAFSMCEDIAKGSYSQYTFMEQIDGSLRRKIGCIMEKPRSKGPLGKMKLADRHNLTNSVFIQTLFALAVLDRKYQIVHGDLHDDNIFLVHDPDLEWNGKRIGDYNYYEYRIDGLSIYIPGIPLIVKLGDFGISVKYSAPMIGNATTMEDGYDQEDGNGPWLPNFYTPAYDTIFVTSMFRERNPSNEFVKKIAAWVCGMQPGYSNEKLNNAMRGLFSKTGRPDISKLVKAKGKAKSPIVKRKDVSPDAILLNPELMRQYLVPPPKGSRVLLIGEL